MNSKIIKGNKIVYEFPFPIQEIRELQDRYLVTLRIPPEKIFNENIFCISNDGKLLWQIEKRELMRNNSPYIGSDYTENELIVFNLYSFAMKVDIDTGKITEVLYTK